MQLKVAEEGKEKQELCKKIMYCCKNNDLAGTIETAKCKKERQGTEIKALSEKKA